jgi:hypothetical protein
MSLFYSVICGWNLFRISTQNNVFVLKNNDLYMIEYELYLNISFLVDEISGKLFIKNNML